jgi:hypothetical protein
MVALALFGVVGSATLRALDRQARFHGGILAILESRSQHAAAHEAVAVEVRSVSSAAGDIGRLSDSAIVFRLPVGGGVACEVTVGQLDLAPDSVASGQTFARFRTTPQPGDTAWVFDEGASDVPADDAWVGLPVTSATRAAGLCPGSSLLDPVLDAARPSWRLAVAGAIPATVTPGASIRLTRSARFALYRGGTGEHWLGFAEAQPLTGAWIVIQPVSGPYRRYIASAPSTSGFALAGHDSSGTTSNTVLPGSPAAISMATRTLTSRAVRMDGVARGAYPDSLHSLIGLRNSR